MRADPGHLFPIPRSGTPGWELEVNHGGSIYTGEIGKSSNKGFSSLENWLNIYQHATGPPCMEEETDTER